MHNLSVTDVVLTLLVGEHALQQRWEVYPLGHAELSERYSPGDFHLLLQRTQHDRGLGRGRVGYNAIFVRYWMSTWQTHKTLIKLLVFDI